MRAIHSTAASRNVHNHNVNRAKIAAPATSITSVSSGAVAAGETVAGEILPPLWRPEWIATPFTVDFITEARAAGVRVN